MENEKFIVVDNAILDFEIYKKDLLLLQKIISMDAKEYFIKLGFTPSVVKRKKLFENKIEFYNKELDLQITFSAGKKTKIRFV